MKYLLMTILLGSFLVEASNAQLKEAAQLATLTPTAFVVTSSDVIPAHKLHYTVSTIMYMGSYMITGSEWKAAVIALLIGTAKELVYDGLMGYGEPLWVDMKWNALGVTQGVVFTLSLKL